jgi:cysteine desulfurase
MLPEAIEVMTEELAQLGNPSSLHNAGRRARRVVEESREQIAEVLNARPSEVVFTSGGTEADNLAVKGLYWARREADPARRLILVTSVEHHAVLDSVGWLSRHEDAETGWLDVDSQGMLRPDALRAAIDTRSGPGRTGQRHVGEQRGRPVLPIAELAEVAHEHGIVFHSDAVQAAAQLPVDLTASGVDALTDHRAQARRSGRRRRAAAPAGHRAGAGSARRRPGTRRAFRDPRRASHPRLRDRRRHLGGAP